ncbi:MAG: glycosyltransferase [Cyclobacteriaceae bacterium]|nr:glycosyltransferase [Cyclobacteriaceae bacterium]
MKPGIILITQQYPFGRGEDFIATELKWYSDNRIPVLILPNKTSGTARSLPEGVGLLLPARAKFRFYRSLLSPAAIWEWCSHPRMWLNSGMRRSFLFYLKTAAITEATLEAAARQEQLDSYQVLYTYWLSGMTEGAARFVRVHPDRKVISRVHWGDLYQARIPGGYFPFRTSLLGRMDKVFPVSEDGKEYLAFRYPAHRQLFVVSRLGTDDWGFRTRPSGDGIIRIVSCSHLTEVKRIDLLIDSLKELSRMMPGRSMQWTHLGDGPVRGALEAQASGALSGTGVSASWVGHLTAEAVQQFYASHPIDVFLNVSDSEGMPVSIMEALCAGIPIVATPVGGVPEMLSGITDSLTPPKPKPPDVAGVLFRVLQKSGDQNFRDQYRKQWEEHFTARFNYEQFYNSLASLFLP